jgi:hypothetical protein
VLKIAGVRRSKSGAVRVYPGKIQEFFNLKQKNKGLGTHVSSLVGLLGEDLVLGLFLDWLEKNGRAHAEVRSYSCTPGTNRGQRLDAWVTARDGKRNILYQVEIKNWSANAFEGMIAELGARDCDLVDEAASTLQRYLTDKKVRKSTLKTLNNMRPPAELCGYRTIIPLLAVWSPVCREGDKQLAPYFKVPNRFRNKKRFPLLHVFSATNYLRETSRRSFVLSMPRVRERMVLLESMVQPA